MPEVQGAYSQVAAEALHMIALLARVGVGISLGTVSALFAIYFVRRLQYILFGVRVLGFIHRHGRDR